MEPDRRSQVSARTVWTIGLNVIAMALAVLFIYRARDIFVFAAVALFLAAAIHPAVSWMERRRLRRGLAVFAVLAAFVLFIGLLLVSFVPLLVEQGRSLGEAAPELVLKLRHHPWIEWADRRFGLVERGSRELQGYAASAAGSILGFVTGLFRGLFATATVAVLTIFMLLFGGEVVAKAADLIGPSRRARYFDLAGRMQKTVGGYVAGALLVASIGGVVVALALLILGVPYFLPLGLAMVLLGIIPYIGPLLGALIIVSTTLAVSGTTAAVIMAVVFGLYQAAENNILQPLVQRHTIRMNPLIILVVLLLGVSLAGVLGALLALPFAGAVQVVLQDMMARAGDS